MQVFSYDGSVHRSQRSLQVMSVVNRSFESAGFSEHGVRKLPRTAPSPLVGRQQAKDPQLKQLTKIKNKPQQGYGSKPFQSYQEHGWYEEDHQNFNMPDCTGSRIETRLIDEEELANYQLPSSPPTQPRHQQMLPKTQCAGDSWRAETRVMQPQWSPTSLWPAYSTYQAPCQSTDAVTAESSAHGSDVARSTAVTPLYEELFRGM